MMTGFAFEVLIGVLDIGRIVFYHFFVAFVAGNIGMGPIQFEPGLAVVEIDRLPVVGFVAGPAIFYALFLELVMVRILVAGCATCG
jgi:hypothetical protein